MFSLQKLAVLFGVITFMWGAFRFIGQIQQMQKQRDKDKRLARKQKKAPPKTPDAKSVDLEACPTCGAFVPGGQHDCNDMKT